jgi:putative membrane protein
MSLMKIALVACASASLFAATASAKSPADLSDTEIAHVAYVADNIDIRYGHLALALSSNQVVRDFAASMVNDHTAVNEQALELLDKLGAAPQDNFLSQKLQADAEKIIDEMSKLRGSAFDRYYANNELAYHKAVVQLVETAFVPNIDHPEVKELFVAGLELFKAHEGHAQHMVDSLK